MRGRSSSVRLMEGGYLEGRVGGQIRPARRPGLPEKWLEGMWVVDCTDESGGELWGARWNPRPGRSKRKGEAVVGDNRGNSVRGP